jgi:hypothetical protein
MLQDISNVVLYLDDGRSDTAVLKVKLQPHGLSIRDVDDLKIGDFLSGHAAELNGNVNLLGLSVHAGQEYPNLAGVDGTAQGEGAFFFLLDGDTPQVKAVGTRDSGKWSWDWNADDVPLDAAALAAGITNELLASQAQIVYETFVNGIWTA